MHDLAQPEFLDVVIIGAGISGIGAGRYLKTEHPGKTFAILEARSTSGGTWDLFRYPGIRSDSDLNTFAYDFKPWRDRDAIASGDKILAYVHETAAENGLEPLIRYQHRVIAAAWSSEAGLWSIQVESDGAEGPGVRCLRAKWIFCASGYYRYDQGYAPEFAGQSQYEGRIVHPQHWPQDLDYSGKKVVVIGSGATAVTLLPAMAAGPNAVSHITMLQRTPSYIVPVSRRDKISARLRKIFGEERGYALTRRKNILRQYLIWQFCQKFPERARSIIRSANIKGLPEGYDVDKHFNPPYDPWDQRLCAVPNGDLFKAIRQGKASIVTDQIDTFTKNGIRLASGQELEADIIVTATGLNLHLFGGMTLTVDGKEVSYPDTVAYRGIMLSGVPNFAFAIGYTNSSWTLKIGLLCQYFCRLLTHMDDSGHDVVWAVAEPGMPTRPLMDFEAGYVKRALNMLPRQGDTAPWQMSMSYHQDERLLTRRRVTDRCLRFAKTASRGTASSSR
ncbi:flavin-containing monooxygenase [Mycobacteroides abscessus]|uniref:NAD(P)/FAD-dependent oxidoreductase n=1 Tax=Mycobacteroides abscessus TaxID=36809 RepID=A0ABD7HI94_9MYCO|nr:NAD(P)/FAD-dependent oxidoreductase [Mycobacteroides abscessus]AWG62828.1 NAD(P)/FAD-dependent oxidoreductase [Mycobacteroides abscessus]PVA73716.1 NAD(P)/FAD-dependent oxidoreductase [Mycobacteroides abscessus]PVB11944.1 NAD(P)/FAD-dependent oxidoreductase [Mycobacteroides abscessus]PVB16637.1 NAD(P)/FAD-dependent oxidoreductase [Mycobacteroides abscessus]RIR41886.1 NAD(P)/FAD-dependent oxidoreductase [Mycobacteroides abscessus]